MDGDEQQFDIFRDGQVHVRKRMCETCIFHDGNRMSLREGRVEEMVAEALAEDTAIVCHDTLGAEHQAVCRGFFERHRLDTFALRLAIAFERVVFDE
jgi:hypothetical protein